MSGWFTGDTPDMGIAPGETAGVPDDFWKKRMAQQLMMNGGGKQGAYGGLANLGSALGGAYALKSMSPDPLAGQKARMAAAGTPMSDNGLIARLFSLGGGG